MSLSCTDLDRRAAIHELVAVAYHAAITSRAMYHDRIRTELVESRKEKEVLRAKIDSCDTLQQQLLNLKTIHENVENERDILLVKNQELNEKLAQLQKSSDEHHQEPKTQIEHLQQQAASEHSTYLQNLTSTFAESMRKGRELGEKKGVELCHSQILLSPSGQR